MVISGIASGSFTVLRATRNIHHAPGGDLSEGNERTRRALANYEPSKVPRWGSSQGRRDARQHQDAGWPTMTLEQLALLLNTLADLIPGWQRLSPEIERWHDCFIGAPHLA
jgi:hypothetical protein